MCDKVRHSSNPPPKQEDKRISSIPPEPTPWFPDFRCPNPSTYIKITPKKSK